MTKKGRDGLDDQTEAMRSSSHGHRALLKPVEDEGVDEGAHIDLSLRILKVIAQDVGDVQRSGTSIALLLLRGCLAVA